MSNIKWQYDSVRDSDNDSLMSTINAYGVDGWELVNIIRDQNGFFIAYLKREYKAET